MKLTANSFLNGVRQSGLIELDRLEGLLQEFRQSGIDCDDSRTLADAFIRRNQLTTWQAGKLLQGRHRGFLLGRYRLLSLLGAGEMSAVFLARHAVMERHVAIKVLPGNKVHDTSYLARFYREAKAVSSLNHPNIVRAFDVDKQIDGVNELHYLVMEFVEGQNLEKYVQERGQLSAAQAADVIRQAAAGLGHAHQAGMMHRDVKPQNFVMDIRGQVKLLDLGLAKFFKQETNEESLTLKHDEKVLGTADFLAPEQAVDSHNVDLRADIYSLGCTFYFALAGHAPFTEGTLVQRLLAHQTRKPTSMGTLRPDVPAGLIAILERMMAKKPADRYQSMAEVEEALGRWLVVNADDKWKRSHANLVAEFAPAAQPKVTPISGAEATVDEMLGLVSELDRADSPPAKSKVTRPIARKPVVARAPVTQVERRREPVSAKGVASKPAPPPFSLASLPWGVIGLVATTAVLLSGVVYVILRGL